MRTWTRTVTFPRRLATLIAARRWKVASPFADTGELPSDVRFPFLLLWVSAAFLVVFLVQAASHVPPTSTATTTTSPAPAPAATLPVTMRLALIASMFALFEGGRRLLFRYMSRRLRNPEVAKETKTSIENFRNLSYVLTTTGGASLVLKLDGVFDVLVMLNVIVGFWYMDFLRPLYRMERSEDSVSYLVVNRAYAHAMGNLVRVQTLLVALALLWLVSGRWSM
jgi:hypothetical protein